jgi:hypothetical protein
MIKLFLLLLFILLNVGSLHASQYYEEGKRYFYNKKYKKAIEYFKLAKEDYSNLEMQLMWAKSEKALGRELYLIAAYERILNLNPNNFDIAMKLNELYKNSDVQGEVINTIDKFNYNDFENFYRGYISKLLHYGSNDLGKLHSNYYAKVDSDQVLYVYDQNNTLYEQEILEYPLKTKTYYNLGVNHSYIFDLDNKGLFFKADSNIKANLKSDASLLNSHSLKVGAEIGKKISDMIFTMPLSYEFTNINKYYKYNVSQISPKAIILLDESHIFDFSFIYSQLSYEKSNMDVLDNTAYGLNSSMRYMMDSNNLHLGISYIKTDSSYSKESYKLFLSNYMPYENFNINFISSFTMDQYEQSFTNRQDRIIDIALEFYSKPIKQARYLYKIRYLSNDTDAQNLKYDKLIFSFGLEFNS